jgi:aldehyde:ferredoxin oxidoreductase
MSADMYNVQMGQPNEAFNIESDDRFANEAELVARLQNFRALTNSAVICNFYPADGEQLLKLIQLATGWDMTIEELVQTGERIFTMMRLLNLRLGYDSKNEGLPELVLRPLEGATEGHVPDIEAQLKTWYKYRGWNRKSGKPPSNKLETLGLAGLI